ncbi:MAG: hypothetical protein D6731_01860 [Planctomycetota bacterium]|nr:MAG: hypothetical protein D6731_01860 [Planctomycetota bacterium]
MVIVYGTGYYGRVQAIPGVGYVATRFAHIYYVPLLPLQSYLVVRESWWAPKEGVKIGPSLLSVFVAWLRAAMVIAGLALYFGLISHRLEPALVGGGLFLLAGLLLGSYKLPGIGRASFRRACKLVERAGLGPRALVAVGLAYGELTPEEASARLLLLEDRGSAPADASDDACDLPARPFVLDGQPLPTRTAGAIKFACPHCRRVSKVTVELRGRVGRCTDCRQLLRVPAPPERARQAA